MKPNSQVETYVALKVCINSWRWKDVPFYIRTGKSLPVTATEVVARLRRHPDRFSSRDPLPPNYVRFRVSPDMAIGIWRACAHAGRDSARRSGGDAGDTARD